MIIVNISNNRCKLPDGEPNYTTGSSLPSLPLGRSHSYTRSRLPRFLMSPPTGDRTRPAIILERFFL
jgi:hypothetical protein